MDFAETIGNTIVIIASVGWTIRIFYEIFRYFNRDGLIQSLKKTPFIGLSVGGGILILVDFYYGFYILIVSSILFIVIYIFDEYSLLQKNTKKKHFEVDGKKFHIQKIYDDNTILIEKSFSSREDAVVIAFKLNDSYSNLSFNIVDNTDKNNLYAKNKFQIMAKPK